MKKQGFASLTPEQLRKVSAQGGKTAHELGVAHRFTSEEAREANRRRHANKKRG